MLEEASPDRYWVRPTSIRTHATHPVLRPPGALAHILRPDGAESEVELDHQIMARCCEPTALAAGLAFSYSSATAPQH
jgi:hypothetical protein